jgi:hypothetical protein
MAQIDNKSQATLKKAVRAIYGKVLPTRRELDELGKKAGEAIGYSNSWTGNYIYILLHLDKYNKPYPKPKYRIPEDLLKGVCKLAGIEQGEENLVQQENNNETNENENKAKLINDRALLRIPKSQLSVALMRKIKKRIKQGRGQGEGKDYIPWLTVREVPSRGQAHRILGLKTHRMHTLFSTLEKKYLLWAEYYLDIDDIREQYPLWIEETIRIAQLLGIKHPISPKTHEPTVMTSDFVFTFHKGMEKRLCVRSVKPSNELEKRRVLEKLEIEEYYWRSRNIDWAIVTEKELPATMISNIELLRRYVDINDRIQLSPEEATNVSVELRKLVNQTSLQEACRNCDDYFGIKRGTSQMLAFHLMAINKWNIDLKMPIALDHRLILLDEINAQ